MNPPYSAMTLSECNWLINQKFEERWYLYQFSQESLFGGFTTTWIIYVLTASLFLKGEITEYSLNILMTKIAVADLIGELIY